MKLAELLQGVAVLSANAPMDMEIGGVCYDSRNTKAGDMFVAVTGFAVDGHKYIGKAVELGATVVLCQEIPEMEVPYVQVADSRAVLAQLGGNWYGHPSKAMTVIGVTGTNGKTTTTYLLKTVLEQTVGAKVGIIGTIHNMIGEEIVETERTTPESFELQGLLAQMKEADCTHVLMEVSSHALVLNRVDGIHFEVGIFSNLTEDHLDFHHTMEEYAQAKALLFTHCAHGAYNIDDPAYKTMMEQATCTTLTYGKADNTADLTAKNVALHSDSVEFDAVYGEKTVSIKLGIPGGFTVYNTMSVLAAGLILNIGLEDMAKALSIAHGVKGRVEVVPTPGTDYTVLIDYAHSPDGLENVLTSVNGFCKGRTIAVFGCGGDRDPIKRPIMGEIGSRLSDVTIITSDNPRTEDPMQIIEQVVEGAKRTGKPYYVEENRRKAIRFAMDLAEKDDIIVLAGKGHETYQILGTIKTHLDEREEVAAHLEELGVTQK
ncbi:MAG: UDP-N-acetylmuramoyl-L-alanyl-D-glutamate--2,6-diaminopimelate ligase [Eubacteriales bacterium]